MTQEPTSLPPTDHEEQQELYERYHLVVDKGQETMRLDKYIQMRLEGVSRNKIQAAIGAGCVQIGGRNSKASYKIKPLDEISILLPQPPINYELIPEPIPLSIVYEDNDVIVVDKPASLVVHPAVGNFYGTLLNGLLYHLDGTSSYPYLVHRIDKDTSGLLLVAKNEAAQVVLAQQFFYHTIERRYVALVWGDFKEDSGTVVGRIGRSPNDRRVMTVYPEEDGMPEELQKGKHAVTHWKVLERFGYVTLIECRLETGRTHQIRCHMQHIGHPLFSDTAYGGDKILKGTTFSRYRQFVENCFSSLPRQALHARILGFEHPTTHQHLHFESPLPKDFTLCLDAWRRYTNQQ